MEAPWWVAVRGADVATLVDVQVATGAKADRFPDGFDPWRKRIGVRVRAQAQEGQANDAVCRLVATAFGVAASDVSVHSGSTDPRKTMRIALRHDIVRDRLEHAFAERR